MEDKSIELYCQYVIKPLEMQMRKLEEELTRKRFFRHKKEIELRIVKYGYSVTLFLNSGMKLSSCVSPSC